MKRIILLILLATSGFSCSEKTDPQPYTYSKVFTGETKKTWKVTFLEETLNGEIVDTFTVGCGTDDEYIFYNNSEHTFEVITGNNKCDTAPEEPDTIKDTWTFSNASATLTMILPFFTSDQSLPMIVRKVKGDKMELEIFLDEKNTSSYRVHFDAIDEE